MCRDYFGVVTAAPEEWEVPTQQWALCRMRI